MICIFVVFSMLHISCTGENRNAIDIENHIEFDTIAVVERHYLGGETENPYTEIDINFVFPVSSKKMDVDSLQRFFVESVFGVAFTELSPYDAVQRYVQLFIDNYIANARIFSEQAQVNTLNVRRDEFCVYEEFLSSDVFFSYYEQLSNTITYNQHGILAFQVKQSNRRDEFIAFDSFRNFVIDLSTGQQLIEDDFFNDGFELPLQRLIIASLLEQNGVQTIDELEGLGFFGIEEIMPNGNFLICDQGITYTFNKGEYSVDQISPPVVFIPYRAIRAQLRRGTVVARLAGL